MRVNCIHCGTYWDQDANEVKECPTCFPNMRVIADPNFVKKVYSPFEPAKFNRVLTDLDLPLAYRTQANLWKMKYLEMLKEVQNANRGLKRLRRKLDSLKKGE